MCCLPCNDSTVALARCFPEVRRYRTLTPYLQGKLWLLEIETAHKLVTLPGKCAKVAFSLFVLRFYLTICVSSVLIPFTN